MAEEVLLQSITEQNKTRPANISYELLNEMLSAKTLFKTTLLNLLSDKVEGFSTDIFHERISFWAT